MKRGVTAVALMVGAVTLVGAFILLTDRLAPDPEPGPVTLVRPAAGTVRADYLADGTPVWVIGHTDGSASVLSGFDTHTPFNIGKLLWWCESAQALDNPHHGSHWDEYGRRFGGPAPADLPSWEVEVRGGRLVLGDRRAASPEAMPKGPPEHEREWCFGDRADVVIHTFEGWDVWTSPRDAVEAVPTGWIRVDGTLLADTDGRVILCTLDGCDGAVVATGVAPPEPNMGQFSPLGPDRFIAQVRDGALLNLTRIISPGN